MTAPVPVEIRGLCHDVGRGEHRRRVLRDVHASVPAGEIVIVTGPSGSGKTTLLTLVGALRSAQEGSLRVLGEQLRGASTRALERVRSRIGFVFQSHNLVEALTALENVELGLRVQGRRSRRETRRLAIEMLEAVGLGAHLQQHPDELSGGQRQRVAVARALASQPALLLADEPTASLDRASGSPPSSSADPRSSPAASASASRWAAPSCASRRPSCWTSPSRTWTPACAWTCARSSPACTGTSLRRSST